jgi:hypothetical protein
MKGKNPMQATGFQMNSGPSKAVHIVDFASSCAAEMSAATEKGRATA